MDGLFTGLYINSSSLSKVENLLFRDYSQSGKLEIRLSKVEFSAKFNLRGVLFLDSESSSCILSRNFFILRNKLSNDFDFFVQVYGFSSSLLLEENSMDYNLFPILVYCNRLGVNSLDFKKIELILFKGSLITVQEPTKSPSIGFLSIINCKFRLIGTDKDFISLKSKISTIIRETTFFLSVEQTRSVLLNSAIFETETLSELFIDSCQFLSFQMKHSSVKLADIQASTSVIYSERGGFNNISIISCLFHLGQKFYVSLLHFEGNVRMKLNQSYLLNNLLNCSNSTLIRIKFSKAPYLILLNSVFKMNRVVLGGILAMEGSFKAKNLKENANYFEFANNYWEHNVAVNKGGLLYIKITWENKTSLNMLLLSLMNKKNIRENKIKSNKASIGSLLFWEGDEVPSKLDLSHIDIGKYNSSDVFPKNNYDILLGSSVDYIKLSAFNDINLDSPIPNFKNIKMPFRVEKQVVKNRVVWGDDFYFCFIMFDKFDFIQHTFSENFLNSSFGKGKSMLPNLFFNDSNLEISFTFVKGMFCAFKMNFFKNYPEIVGREHQLHLSTEIFYKLFSFMSKSKIYNISIIYKVDACKMGEVFDSEFCIPCERDKYSLNTNLKSLVDCITCKDYDYFNCYGASLRSPKKNHWRLNNDSLKFLRCPGAACRGDEDFTSNFTQRDCLSCYLPMSKRTKLFFSFDANHTAVGSCKAPYEGYLCTQCREGFGSLGVYKCGDCSSLWIYMKQFLLLAVKMGLFVFTNWKALQNKIEMSQKRSRADLVDNYKSTFLLKILFKHFNMLSVLLALPFDFDDLFNDTFSSIVSISPTESFDIFSFECLLKKLQISLAPVYAKTLINLVFFLLSLIFFFYLMSPSEKRIPRALRIKKFFTFIRKNGTAICLIFFLDNIVSLLDPYFKILFVTNLGDERIVNIRLLSDFSLHSWNLQHKFFVLALSLPSILVFAVILPLYLLYRILKAKSQNKLYDKSFKRKFSYFIFPYSNNALYFEVIMIYNKLILILFKSYMRMSVIQDDQKVSVLFFFFYLVGLYTFQTIKPPYSPDKFSVLQKVELLSLVLSISNALCALIFSLLETKQESFFNWLLIVYALTTNTIFFLSWLQKYFSYFKGRLKLLQRAMTITFDRVFKKQTFLKTTTLIAQNEMDFEKLYEEELQKNNELRNEIAKLRELNKDLLSKIESLEDEKNEIINDEETTMKKPTFDKEIALTKKKPSTHLLSQSKEKKSATHFRQINGNKFSIKIFTSGFDLSTHRCSLALNFSNALNVRKWIKQIQCINQGKLKP